MAVMESWRELLAAARRFEAVLQEAKAAGVTPYRISVMMIEQQPANERITAKTLRLIAGGKSKGLLWRRE